MKKLIFVGIVLTILFLCAIKWKMIDDRTDRFIESNQAHERKLIQDFLSQ